jgi:hypothetical protein
MWNGVYSSLMLSPAIRQSYPLRLIDGEDRCKASWLLNGPAGSFWMLCPL